MPVDTSHALTTLDGLGQARLVHEGEVHPRELVEAAVDAVEAVNPAINAVIHERFERALAEAEGIDPAAPFAGVPIVVKDLDGTTAGDPYHAGSAHLRQAGYVADHDSWLNARLRAAGMIVLGRTNVPELGLVPTTEPLAHGPTRNPWDPTRSPGGSSGGSAAVVATRAVALAHGGDGGGSIRIPASACGLVGLLPSRGRTSLGPDSAEVWGGFVRRHVLTRSVRDSAAVLDVVHGWQPGDPYAAPTPARPFLAEVGADPGRLRIGVLRRSPDPRVAVEPEPLAAVDQVAGLLAHAGHDVVDQEDWLVPEADATTMLGDFLRLFTAWTAQDVARLGALAGVPVTPDTVEPGTWALAEAGRQVTALEYLDSRERLAAVSRSIARWWADGHDLLLTPTLACLPPELGQFAGTPDDPGRGGRLSTTMVAFTAPFNVTGQPALSLPVHWSPEGLPVGVQLVAAYGREDVLLRVASQLEATAPWSERVPPIHA